MKNMNERSQQLFSKMMSLYLNDGKPVGSSVLAKMPDVVVSSATIRNVMSDLEKMGLIHSPHTSAGRVPTELGFRVFVDSILTYQPVNHGLQAEVELQLNQNQTQDELLGSASQVLSGLTGMASVVMMPNKEQEILKHIDFVPLSKNKVLVVLVLNDQDIQNRIIELDKAVSPSELVQVANYLNQHFSGLSLSKVKTLLVTRLDALRQQMDALMVAIVEATDQAIGEQIEIQQPYLISGQSNLFNYQELASSEKLKALFESFEQHTQLVKLMGKSIDAKGVQVFIGRECGSDLYQGCSVITTPYESEGVVLGVLGVIGPSRMPYDKIVPKIDMTAKIVSKLFNR